MIKNLINKREKERLKKWTKFTILIIWAQIYLLTTGSVQICAGKSIGQGEQWKVMPDSIGIKKAKNPTGAMVRSLVFPGWGQAYNGKWLKAGVVFVTETGLIVNAVYWDRQAKKSTNAWDRDFCRNNRNLSLWWLAAVVLLSMGDAYVDAHLSNFDVSPDLSLRSWRVGVKCKLVWGR